MSLPNNFPGQKAYNVVVGGDKNDPDPLQLTLLKVFDPLRHPDDIPIENLPFVGTEGPANQEALEKFTAAPEPGTIVVTSFNMGDPSARTSTGMPNQINSGKNVSGNDSPGKRTREEANEKKSGKNPKPNLVKKIENGVEVYEAIEKGIEWSHSLTKDIATHAAWSQMLGQNIPELKNIPTAIQNFASIPGLNAISNMPGKNLNVKNVFNNLTENQKQSAIKNMPAEVASALESIMFLLTEIDRDLYNVTTERIHPEIYTENMITLLSQVTNLSDLLTVIGRLQNDKSIRGYETYSKLSNSGLKATSESSNNTNSISKVFLSDIADKSIIHFDVGNSVNINNKTYIVQTTDLKSNVITVVPKIEQEFKDANMLIYEPVFEYETNTPYGNMTMTMDANGNIRPNKDSTKKMQQAMQSLISLMNSTKAGAGGMFGDSAQTLAQMYNRIGDVGRVQAQSRILEDAQKYVDYIQKNSDSKEYPFLELLKGA